MNESTSRCLILVPTAGELDRLQSAGLRSARICGFGVAVSGAESARIIAETRPDRVLLAGIAGTYKNADQIGTASLFQRVACYGIGIGSGSAFQTAADAGWSQLRSVDPDSDPADELALSVPASLNDRAEPLLLTCTTGSCSTQEVEHKRAAFPDATAEDMEGFAVAVACHRAGIPLSIIRGISNVAGDRDKSNWDIAGAMQAVADLLTDIPALKNVD